MTWESVIGLEVHAELSTKSKIFCACSTEFGGEPNSHVCPVCSGMPGTLPTLNKNVVEYATRLGLVLDCKIAGRSVFDRKNYFYPDLPKAYQVSQLYAPICTDGCLTIESGEQAKNIGIREIHMEEDAGKLIHAEDGSYMDFNRCGVPLLEIVTLPDFRDGDEVIAFLEKLREILLYLDICDCKMQEGSLRVDVNLSLRPDAAAPLGTRTEMKNLNSFKAVRRAIAAEEQRHRRILEGGGAVRQETRRWDDETGQSHGLRTKENAPDYRYFPEPDLLPVIMDAAWLARIKSEIPELAHEKRVRYQRDWGLSDADAKILTGHKRVADLFESIAEKSAEALEAARLMTGEIMHLAHEANISPEDMTVSDDKLALLVSFVAEGKISRGAYKETVEAVFRHDTNPETYISEKNLWMQSDDESLGRTVETVLSENAAAVEDYQNGKDKAFGFLVGQCMRKLGAGTDPAKLRALLAERLGAR